MKYTRPAAPSKPITVARRSSSVPPKAREPLQAVANAVPRRPESRPRTGPAASASSSRNSSWWRSLASTPAADQFQPFRAVGHLRLPAADRGRAAHAVLPKAAVRVAERSRKTTSMLCSAASWSTSLESDTPGGDENALYLVGQGRLILDHRLEANIVILRDPPRRC